MGSLLLMAAWVKEEEEKGGKTEGGENRHMWGVQEGFLDKTMICH